VRVERATTTRDGAAIGIFLVALVIVALVSSNNLVMLMASGLLAAWAVSSWLGRRNLAGVTVRRVLPAEVHAGQPVRFVYELSAHGGLPRFDIAVREQGARRAVATCHVLVPGERAVVSGSQVFRRRGHVRLRGLELRSGFPFRIVQRTVAFDAPDELWVFPDPADGGHCQHGEMPGLGQPGRQPEQPRELREYRPGDRLRDVHWPTTARVGRPMVRVRDRAQTQPVWVEVRETEAVPWEVSIRRAAGAILDAASEGRPVGLRAGARQWPPRAGDAWRRELLTALAMLPVEPS
jgi:uncharacterized protein (DUF58 family)